MSIVYKISIKIQITNLLNLQNQDIPRASPSLKDDRNTE